jgi:predicted regulator of Ras-like GTPase activity (Roadblock/LC7/MglB family)
MATRTEKITQLLKELRVSSPDILGLTVITSDGFLIAAVAPSEIDEELVAGMSAALLGIGERISRELMQAPMQQIFVKSEKGYIIINAVGKETVLALFVSSEARLGLIFLELQRMVPELQKVL